MSIIPQKHCSKCDTDKPIDQFHKQAQSPDGYRSSCKQCRKVESKEYYWRDPELQRAKCAEYRQQQPGYGVVALRQPYYCSRCQQTKDASAFGVDRRRRFGHYPFCNECRKDERRQRAPQIRIENRRSYLRCPEKYIESSRKWVKANPRRRKESSQLYAHRRRAWKRGGTGAFTQQEWVVLCEQYDNRCLCCGRSDVRLSPDHIVPLSRGGSNTIDNIQPLCRDCNAHKFTQTIDYRHETNHTKEVDS